MSRTENRDQRILTSPPVILLCLITAIPVFSNARAQGEISDGSAFAEAPFDELSYRMVGPSRGGRVTAVAGHRSNPATFLMGATGGGVWRTSNYGMTWNNVSDGYFATGSIGSIDIADSNPDIVYVGTGSDGIRSNVIIGRGLYRSADGGDTWELSGLAEAGQLASVVIHPTNPEVVFVAAMGSPFGPGPERGVYRTLDGGKSWANILAVSDSTGAVDVELHPSNPDIVYAAMWRAERKPWTIISGDDSESGIYRSADGGSTWTKIEQGVPDGLVGKIDFAVSPADPSRVYALIEAVPPDEGLYRSNDAGLTWSLVSSRDGLMNRPFYYTNVDADPVDADIVYVSNEGFYKSSDGGYTFERRSTPHGDNHDMWINPDDPDIYIQSNDGGANVTVDGGETWSSQYNQPTAELYQVNVDDRFPYWLYAGQQDNSTIAVPSIPPDSRPGGPTAYWESIGGCETGPVVPRPGQPEIVYANCKGRFGRYSRDTGQEQQFYVGAVDMYGRNPAELPYRFQRVVPIEVSPHDPNVIYHGSQFVHRTTDEGITWETVSPDLTAFDPSRQMISGGPITRDITGEEHYSTLYVIEESPLEKGVIWTGSNDGIVAVSTDSGETWRTVTPDELPPDARIQTIEPSTHTAGKIYLAAYRYLLDDWQPYIFVTTDYGLTWSLLTSGENGIPEDHPVRVVREDTEREGLLFAGTEFGMFVSFDDGGAWHSFQLNLPATPVTDIKVVSNDLVLSTMGRSFWIMDNIGPLRQWRSALASEALHIFDPADSHLMRYNARRRADTDPEYPEPGAQIDYFVSDSISGPITLSVLGGEGETIRVVASDSSAVPEQESQGMREPPGITVSTALSDEPGFHRFIWDHRHFGAIDSELERSRGPKAAPGTYEIVLEAGEITVNATANVLLDPRIENDGVTNEDLKALEALNLELRGMTSELWLLIAEIDSTIADISDESSNHRTALESLRLELVTDPDESYPPRVFYRQLSYLLSMLGRAAQPPGSDAYRRADELRTEWDSHRQRANELLTGTQVE